MRNGVLGTMITFRNGMQLEFAGVCPEEVGKAWERAVVDNMQILRIASVFSMRIVDIICVEPIWEYEEKDIEDEDDSGEWPQRFSNN